MIIHAYNDGSCGLQYEVGDKVIVNATIPGGWFDIGPTKADYCTVRKVSKKDHWSIATIHVMYSLDWGLVPCFPWMLEPHPETIALATIVDAVD